MSSEQISTLNQIVALVDSKAAEFKNEFMRWPQSKRFANKKLILDLIDDANTLGQAIKPVPTGLLDDLKRLGEQLTRLNA
jgi:hypothetical protein